MKSSHPSDTALAGKCDIYQQENTVVIVRSSFDRYQFFHELFSQHVDSLYTDVRIHCDDGDIDTHRLLLASVSSFLKQLFLQYPDDEDVLLILPGFKAEDVRALLLYLYKGQCSLTDEQMTRIGKITCILQINLKNVTFIGMTASDTMFQKTQNISSSKEQFEDNSLEMKWPMSSTSMLGETLTQNRTLKTSDTVCNSSKLQSLDADHCKKLSTVDIEKDKKPTVPTNIEGMNKSVVYEPEVVIQETVATMCVSKEASVGKPEFKDDHIKVDFPSDRKCKVCGKFFRYGAHMRNHMRKHTGERPFKCKYCEKRFALKSVLINHIRLHTSEKPFSCQHCGKAFTQASARRAHVKSHIETPSETNNENSDAKLKDEGKAYECHLCGKRFNKISRLNRHMKSRCCGEDSLTCELCGKIFCSKSNLIVHKRTHTGDKPHVCNTCNRGFTCKRSLDDHMKIHTGEKPFQCEVCGRTFRTKRILNGHVKSKHTGEKTHQCQACGKEFCYYNTLKYHIKSFHSGERSFQCELCGKGYYSSSGLHAHKRTHSGEKPHVCQTCNKGFTCKNSLRIHYRIHTGEKPFQCNVCDMKFTQGSALKTHMRVHTGEKPYSCVMCGMKFAYSGSLKSHSCFQ